MLDELRVRCGFSDNVFDVPMHLCASDVIHEAHRGSFFVSTITVSVCNL